MESVENLSLSQQVEHSSKFYVQHSTLHVRSSSNPPSLILYMESKLGCDIPTIHNLTLVDFQIKDISGMDLTLLNFKKH